MALQDLLAALRSQAAERRAETLERARSDAARIRAEAETARERRRREYLVDVREDEEARARRAVARARREAAQGLLAARGHMLERVRAALEERMVRAVDDPEYRRIVSDELHGVLERLPDGPVRIRASSSLAGLVRELAAERYGVTVEQTDDGTTGFVALADGDRVELDARLQARVDQAWPRLAVGTLAEVET